MSAYTITDTLRRECGFGLDIPEGDERRKWVRIPCPFCGAEGSRPPAAVNHHIGWFVCHRCGERRSANRDLTAATRFIDILRLAAYKSWRQFPGVWSLNEARSNANERLAVYAGPDDGRWADSGALGRWEKACESEDQLDSWVYQALSRDLLDQARGILNRKYQEVPFGDGTTEDTETPGSWMDHLGVLLDGKQFEDWESMRDTGQFPQQEYPLLYATKIDGLTREEVAEVTGWSVSTVRDRIAEEKRRMAETFLGRREAV